MNQTTTEIKRYSNGRPKKIITTYYKGKAPFRIIVRELTNATKPLDKKITEYSGSGKKVYEIRHRQIPVRKKPAPVRGSRPNRSRRKENPHRIYITYFDKKERKLREIEKTGNDLLVRIRLYRNGIPVSERIYDSQGRETKDIYFQKGKKLIQINHEYWFDKNVNEVPGLTEPYKKKIFIMYKRDGKTISNKSVWEYDASTITNFMNAKPIREVSIDYKNGKKSLQYTYTQGKKLVEIRTYKNGKLSKITTFP